MVVVLQGWLVVWEQGKGVDACVDVKMSKILVILETFFFRDSRI